MKKRYSAAIAGYGGYVRALRRAWANRFSSIKAIVLVPELDERLSLSVHYDAAAEADIVTLARSNWRTGEESTLYKGPLTNGLHKQPRRQRD